MPRKISEQATRKQMIDPQLEQAGWYLRADTDSMPMKSIRGDQLDALLLSVLNRAFKGEL